MTPHIGPHTVGKPYLKSVYTVKRAKMNLTNLNAIPTGCQASHLLTREINLKNKKKNRNVKTSKKNKGGGNIGHKKMGHQKIGHQNIGHLRK